MEIEVSQAPRGKSITVIGAGNVGSQLAGHLARMPEISRIVICDHQSYETKNLFAQEIDRSDVGAAKAKASARRLRKIRRDLQVLAIVDRVENVPWGLLRADLIVGCVDSKASRAHINLIARRLGIKYVDVGIRADGLMVRVDVLGTREEDACLECSFTEKDYAMISQTYSCDGNLHDAPATGASSALGGLAAALAALQCARFLAGNCHAEGAQLVMEAQHHHVFVNRLTRNSRCRFDHRPWEIKRATVRVLGDLARDGMQIGFDGKSWITRLVCPRCRQETAVTVLQGRMSAGIQRCPGCGDLQAAPGFSMRPRLQVSGDLIDRPVGDVGLRCGDVVFVEDREGAKFIELAVAGAGE